MNLAVVVGNLKPASRTLEGDDARQTGSLQRASSPAAGLVADIFQDAHFRARSFLGIHSRVCLQLLARHGTSES